jgi:hypothetical protein
MFRNNTGPTGTRLGPHGLDRLIPAVHLLLSMLRHTQPPSLPNKHGFD